jgi:iron complex transport system ATP-binding protein
MAVAQDAETILLDEPTTYMDINHRIDIMRILSELNRRGKNIIMVAHDLPQAFTYGSEIQVLHKGTIIEAGKPCNLCMNTKLKSIFGVTLEKSRSAAELYKYHLIK